MYTKKIDCIFCNIDASKIIFEDEYIFAIYDIYPKFKTHILIITKNHVTNLLDDNCLPIYMEHIFHAIRYLTKKLNLSHCKILVNNGPEAGQVVFHLHVHLMSNM